MTGSRTAQVTAVVLDLGGVLLGYDFTRWARRVAPHCRPDFDPMCAFQEYDRAHAASCGHVDLDDLHRWFVRRAGLTMDLDEFTHAWNHIFWRMDDMIALVPRLRADRRYLLSNTNPAHVRHIREHYSDVLALFDGVFLSCELGLTKPDPAIYQAVATHTGLPNNRHLFVDDMLPNVQGAQTAGWQALHFTGREQLERELRARALL